MEVKAHDACPSLITAQRDYIDRILRLVKGLKVLVLDQDAKQAISLVYSHSELLAQDVALTETLDAQAVRHEEQQPMHYAKAVVLARPTPASMWFVLCAFLSLSRFVWSFGRFCDAFVQM